MSFANLLNQQGVLMQAVFVRRGADEI